MAIRRCSYYFVCKLQVNIRENCYQTHKCYCFQCCYGILICFVHRFSRFYHLVCSLHIREFFRECISIQQIADTTLYYTKNCYDINQVRSNGKSNDNSNQEKIQNIFIFVNLIVKINWRLISELLLFTDNI